MHLTYISLFLLQVSITELLQVRQTQKVFAGYPAHRIEEFGPSPTQ